MLVLDAEDNTQYELQPLPHIAYNLAAYRTVIDFRTWKYNVSVVNHESP